MLPFMMSNANTLTPIFQWRLDLQCEHYQHIVYIIYIIIIIYI
jgi:hypothetical protein